MALQGGFREHCEAFARLGVEARQVRTPEELDGVDALVIPGGESTAIGKLLKSSGLLQAITATDVPVMGTCAGMILSASHIEDGIADQVSLAKFDATVRRNGVGPQRLSFEAPLDVAGLDTPFQSVFIRPPVVEKVGNDVEVLARNSERPVLCRQGRNLFATFHPELSGDDRIHQLFLERL